MQHVHWVTMRRHVMRKSPLEACGLLAGIEDRVKSVLPLHNAAQSRVLFRIDPQAQYEAFQWMEANELDLVGIFHSHPKGPDTVSERDIAEAAYPVVSVVWSRNGKDWDARGFWIAGERVTRVSLQIIPAE